jgi:hypothetical protein
MNTDRITLQNQIEERPFVSAVHFTASGIATARNRAQLTVRYSVTRGPRLTRRRYLQESKRKTKISMPSDNVLRAGAATAVLGIWWAIELAFPRHRATPSRDWDKGSLLALNVAHGFQLVGMLVGFLDVGRIDGDDAPLQLSGLGLLLAGIALRWTAIRALAWIIHEKGEVVETQTPPRGYSVVLSH